MARFQRMTGGVIAVGALYLVPLGLMDAGTSAPALAGGHAAAPVRVQDSGGGGGPDCFHSSGAPVLSEHGWSFYLRDVGLADGVVVVSLSMRNQNARTGLIALAPDVRGHTRLVDPAGGEAYPVEEVDGLEVKLMKIERRKSATVRFTFPRPGTATRVNFNSTLVAPIMRGAGQKLLLDLPLELPVGCEA